MMCLIQETSSIMLTSIYYDILRLPPSKSLRKNLFKEKANLLVDRTFGLNISVSVELIRLEQTQAFLHSDAVFLRRCAF